jgi:hypothetical protein
MSIDSVYVSYSRTAEKQTPVVDSLSESCRAHRLDFRRDKERLKHGNLIRAFMDEIGSSGNIVPIFSRCYFESEYCMYELLQVWKAGNFHQRIHPVSLGDIRLDDVKVQLDLVDYWKKKTEDLQEELNKRDLANTIPLQTRRIVYADIYRHINELMAFVSNMNILPLDTLRQQNFAPLLERIKPSQPQGKTAIPQRKRAPDRDFRQKIGVEIQQILNQRSNLQIAIRGSTTLNRGE